MASVERRERDGKITWRAHWRDPDGRQRNRSFTRKVDATAFLTTVEGTKLAGSYIDPGRAQLTVGALADQWLAGKIGLRPTTRARYESALRVHVLPRWGAVPIARVTHGDAQAWLAGLVAAGQSGASVRKAHGVLARVLDLAVKDRRIPANPVAGVDLPRMNERRRKYLDAEQVERLAAAAATLPDGRPRRATDAAFAQYRLVVLVLAYCGLRWSEVAGLRVGRIDLMRRRLDVAEADTEVDGASSSGVPRSRTSHAPCRSPGSSPTIWPGSWPGGRLTTWCSPHPTAG